MGILKWGSEGEVFGTWSYLTTTKRLIACHQTMLNHTGNKDLHKLLVEVINQGKQELIMIKRKLRRTSYVTTGKA